jgi:hypothetical protein
MILQRKYLIAIHMFPFSNATDASDEQAANYMVGNIRNREDASFSSPERRPVRSDYVTTLIKVRSLDNSTPRVGTPMPSQLDGGCGSVVQDYSTQRRRRIGIRHGSLTNDMPTVHM